MPEAVASPAGIATIGLVVAFFGVLALGFYERRRTFDIITETIQRTTMLSQQAMSSSVRGQHVLPPAHGLPPSTVEPGARPVAPVPGGHDLSDDDVWKELNAQWAREALDVQQVEQQRADVIHASLQAAQARRAAALAEQGKLADGEEQEQGASVASEP